MTFTPRLAAIAGAFSAALLLAAASSADESLARRVAALKAIVDPSSIARATPAPSGAYSSACAGGAWWRTSDYALQSRIATAIRDASLRYQVDQALIRAVIRHESAYDVDARSPKGALGLMQLMPQTARTLGVVCPHDPRQNILGGTRYLREMRDRLGSWPRAVAAYNAGPSAIEAGRLPDETRIYVRRVIGTWRPERTLIGF